MDHVTALQREIQAGILPDLNTYLHLMGKTALLDVVMATNRHGDTVLHVAARHGHQPILKYIHEDLRVELNHVNLDGKSALHEAAQQGHVECIRYLLEAGCHVDCLKKADWTPLMLACTKDNKDIVNLLLQNQASLSLRNKDGWTPFHIACREGHSDIVSLLLDNKSTCWDTKSNNGRTPLHTVALHGNIEVAKILHDRCHYDVNTSDSCGVTSLMDAVRGNHMTMTKYLLEWGADLNHSDILGRQAIHHGSQAGSEEVLSYIIKELGTDVNMATKTSGTTPLHYAAKEGQSGVILLLLSCGANITAKDKHGRTALDIARKARSGETAVRILMDVLSRISTN